MIVAKNKTCIGTRNLFCHYSKFIFWVKEIIFGISGILIMQSIVTLPKQITASIDGKNTDILCFTSNKKTKYNHMTKNLLRHLYCFLTFIDFS